MIETQDSIAELLAARRWDELREALLRMHPSDIAEVIIEHPAETEGIIFRLLSKEKAASAFSYLPPAEQRQLLESLSNEQVRRLLDEMNPDDRTHLLEEMPAEVTRELLLNLNPEEIEDARRLLNYPENTAGRFMTPEYAWIYPDMTAERALAKIRDTGRGKETLNWVYVIDSSGKLVEDVRLANLVLAHADTNVLDIDDPELVSVRATDDRDSVLKTFAKYDRTALPVTDDQGYLLGIITVDDVLDIAQQRATEDIQKLGGSEVLGASYLDVNLATMLRKRGGWLAALFLGEMLTATAMGFFEAEIARAVVLALFVPLIISSGGNSGSQATSLIIRALALRELKLGDWWKVCGREIGAGLVLGSFLGAIGFFRIVLWQHLHFTDYGPHYLLVAFTVCGALIGVVAFGTLTGSMLPFLLRKLGFDPATASAPFVATLVDVTGLCIYFGVALLVLRGTLL
jgi:magnesium transporter